MEKNNKQKISIYDVAREAGVSIGTVSRVINGGHYVSEHIRERVMEVIEQFGFTPSKSAQNLARGMKSKEEKDKERRVFKRFPCHLAGNYLSLDESSGKVRLRDISDRGVGLISDTPLTAETILNLNIVTKKKRFLNLKGKVCWCKEIEGNWRAGISFDKPLFIPLGLY